MRNLAQTSRSRKSRSLLGIVAFAGLVCLTVLSCGRSQNSATEARVTCDVSPDSLGFGRVLLQHSAQLEFTVRNSSHQRLSLQPSKVDEPFTLVFLDTTILEPGESKTATLAFSPQTPGIYEGVLSLGENDCDQIVFTGTGIQQSCDVTPSSLDFAYQKVGSNVEKSFSINNTGTEPLYGVLGATCSDFAINPEGSYVVPPGDSLTIYVQFAPRSLGLKQCSVDIGNLNCVDVQCTGKAYLGRTWLVSQIGNGDTETIQAAIDSSVDGDTVLVEPGRYLESIDLGNRQILVQSLYGAGATIIDGSNYPDAVVTIGPLATRRTVLSDFTVTGGTGSTRLTPYPSGGGLLVEGSPVIRNCIVSNNEAVDFGGGLYSTRSDYTQESIDAPLIENNVFKNNIARSGAAVMLSTGSPVVRGNTFEGNQANFDGGGIFIYSLLNDVVIERNTFNGNIAGDHGGGIAAWSEGPGKVEIMFNVFINNGALGEDSGGINGIGGAVHLSGTTGSFRNNTVVRNTSSSPCGGAGVLIYGMSGRPGTWTIERNILAYNSGAGLMCLNAKDQAVVLLNIFYGNSPNVGCATGTCESFSGGGNVEVDPKFCNLEANDLHPALDSPALLLVDTYIGALDGSDCTVGSARP